MEVGMMSTAVPKMEMYPLFIYMYTFSTGMKNKLRKLGNLYLLSHQTLHSPVEKQGFLR